MNHQPELINAQKIGDRQRFGPGELRHPGLVARAEIDAVARLREFAYRNRAAIDPAQIRLEWMLTAEVLSWPYPDWMTEDDEARLRRAVEAGVMRPDWWDCP